MDCCKNCVYPKRHVACWHNCTEYLAEKAEKNRAQIINADRIRAMDNEELAEILYQFAHSNVKPLNKENLFEWLQQPAEEVRG